jgi:hypothetical protein
VVSPLNEIVFVDVETTGLDVHCPILQVAAVAVDSNLNEIDCFEAKLRFNLRRIPATHRRRWPSAAGTFKVPAPKRNVPSL